jgi:hypothetical protein
MGIYHKNLLNVTITIKRILKVFSTRKLGCKGKILLNQTHSLLNHVLPCHINK